MFIKPILNKTEYPFSSMQPESTISNSRLFITPKQSLRNSLTKEPPKQPLQLKKANDSYYRH